MIPPDVRQVLEPLMGRTFPWESVDLHRRLPLLAAQALLPNALAPAGVASVLSPFRGFASTLRTAAVTLGRDVFIDPKHYNTKTAAGLALIRHELVHVEQGERNPDFLRQYQELSVFADPNRPWDHPMEREAYMAERDTYCALVAQGYPKGSWTPLGVTIWGCY